MDFEKKYLKYKNKYLELKNQTGGIINLNDNDNLDFFFNFNSKKDTILNTYNFYDYESMDSPINRVGEPSENGFVNKLVFKNKNKTKNFTAVMKNSIKKSADNNYYEYVAGNCINKLKTYFPNFIYTLRFMFLTPVLKEGLKNGNFTKLDNFKDTESKEMDEDNLLSYNNIGKGCKNNDKASILIEHIPNSLNINNLLSDSNFNEFENVEVYNILFQIYACLSSLKNFYTHYDLHYNNVMFVKIPDNKIVQIDYNINNKEYKIYTHFIPVIIDYGRSHVNCLKLNDKDKLNLISSKIFSEIACENPDCNSRIQPGCKTYNSGLIIERDANEYYSKMDDFYSIDIRHPNQSIDLRFINLFMTKLNSNLPIKLKYEKFFDQFWLSNTNNYRHLDKTTPLLPGIRERPSNLYILGKISTTTDCLAWLIEAYDESYLNSSIINKKKYGSIKINTNMNKNIKWSFEKSV